MVFMRHLPLLSAFTFVSAAVVFLGASSVVVHAQKPTGAVYDSYRRAATVLRQAAAAHGGDSTLRALRTATVTWRGNQFLRTQGRVAANIHAARPDSEPIVQQLWIDLQRSRARRSLDASLPGGYRNQNQLVLNGRELMAWDAGRIFSGTALTRDTTGIAAPAQFGQLHEMMPPLLVRLALSRIGTARWLGAGTANGRPTQAITISTTDGRQLALHFDAKTKLLAKLEVVANNAVFGDVTVSTTFIDYDTKRPIPLSRRVRTALNGETTIELQLAGDAFDTTIPDSLFARPEGYSAAPAAPRPGARQAAENVWFIEGVNGYRSMFVDTDSGIVVIDAPLSSAVTEQMIGIIGQTLPNKPIRYVAITHHHEDHIGGLRSYIARGVTVLVPPGTEGVIRELARATPTLIAADSLAKAPRPLSLQTVTGRRMIGSGARAVEILDLSPTSHAAGMLAAYVPSAKILFQGDMIRINDVGPILPALAVTKELGAAIEILGLDVQTIGSVHGRNGTIEELREAIQKP